MDSILAIYITQKHDEKKKKNGRWFTNPAYLSIPRQTSVAARERYTPDETQAPPSTTCPQK